MPHLPGLSAFLSGYFHQDWPLEYAGPTEAAVEFASQERFELATAVLAELAMIAAADLAEDSIENILVETGCYYRPIDSSLGAWLRELQQEIGSTLWTRVQAQPRA